MFGKLARRLRFLLKRRRSERDMNSEIQFHIDMETANTWMRACPKTKRGGELYPISEVFRRARKRSVKRGAFGYGLICSAIFYTPSA